ncbi:transmembrane protein 238-like [Cervus elaphus]|uniref:transmembrane protein 238-like n=1 Tax=Cervus canadensis TaxID=1574408 RepID=UPI001C9E37A2|nr:transmembrane protein 238-like [Cervus canadensis]XP_043756873.1 transmembrane protein 238-like [Cervus elaphus]
MPSGERRQRLAAPSPAHAGRPGEQGRAPPAPAFPAMLLGKLWGTCSLGRCALFFGLALLLDVVGLVLLLVGIFASLDFWDFLIYTGSLILAFSLLFWIAWYTLNIEVPLEKLDL